MINWIQRFLPRFLLLWGFFFPTEWYVARFNQIAALVYSCTNQNAALVYSCTNHSVRELPLMPIMPYNDWVASKTSLAVFRFQMNNRYWKFFFFSTLKLLYAEKMCAYRNIAHPQFSWDFVMTFCKLVINRFVIPKKKKKKRNALEAFSASCRTMIRVH